MVRSVWLLRASSLVCLVWSAGCAAQRMAVPQDVGKASDEIVISDRSAMSGALADESFTMGPYRVTDVSRKWDSTTSSTVVGVSSSDAKGGFTFGVKAPEGQLKGTCASHQGSQSAGMFGTQSYDVVCQCGGPTQATFSISADTTSHYKGTVTAGSASYVIAGVYTDDKGSNSSKPIGYEVRGTDPVGAVEVAGKGRVWLSKTLDAGARANVACLFAGLLLYKDPGSNIAK
jgi:hypothetical protein